MQTLAIAENSNTNLKKKLAAEEQAWKSADVVSRPKSIEYEFRYMTN